jgi:hypothetical protein
MIVGCPKNSQPWLDGFNSGGDSIKQFVAMPLGMGYTVEGQVTGKEEFGGIQLIAYKAKSVSKVMKEIEAEEEARKERERVWAARRKSFSGGYLMKSMVTGSATKGEDYDYGCASSMDWCEEESCVASAAGPATLGFASKKIATRGISAQGQSLPKSAEIGLAMGGKMKQKIYEDCYGIDDWDQSKAEKVFVHIVNSEMYKQITGEYPPDSQVSARHYTQYGYPWFDIYDEGVGHVAASPVLAEVKTIAELDKKHGFEGQQSDLSVNPNIVVTYHPKLEKKDPNVVTNGVW